MKCSALCQRQAENHLFVAISFIFENGDMAAYYMNKLSFYYKIVLLEDTS